MWDNLQIYIWVYNKTVNCCPCSWHHWARKTTTCDVALGKHTCWTLVVGRYCGAIAKQWFEVAVQRLSIYPSLLTRHSQHHVLKAIHAESWHWHSAGSFQLRYARSSVLVVSSQSFCFRNIAIVRRKKWSFFIQYAACARQGREWKTAPLPEANGH